MRRNKEAALSKTGCSIALFALIVATAAPVAAEPITYQFSTTVTQAFGPIQDIFGRTFVRGDSLSGQVILDPATFTSDSDTRDTNAQYGVATGRLVFDVPSGFSMDAAAIERFDALVENGSLDYARVDLFDQLTPGAFNALQVTWIDPTGRAFSSTAWPTTLQGLTVTELRFNGFRGNGGSITLYGDSPAPVPEPATMSLLAGGLLATFYRVRQRRTS